MIGRNHVRGLGRHQVLGQQLLGSELQGRRHHQEGRPDVQHRLAVKPGLARHGGPRLGQIGDIKGCSRSCQVAVPGMEQGLAIGHVRIGGEDAPDHVGFKGGSGRAEERRHPGEGIEIVIDQHLAGDADDLAIGLDAVGLLRLPDGAALELAQFIHLLELRGFTQLQALDRLEVGNGRPPRDRLVGPGCCLIGLPECPVGDTGQDLREVGGRMKGARGNLVAPQALHPAHLQTRGNSAPSR